jgi:Putative Ig domain
LALIVTDNFPSGSAVIGTSFDAFVTASGGTPPYTYAVTAGELPDGLTLDPTTGEISGTVTELGFSSWTITATDSATPIPDTGDDSSFSLRVDPGIGAPTFPLITRHPVRWNEDGCQPMGRQFARIFYDAFQMRHYVTNLTQNLQQPLGLVKSLLFNCWLQSVDMVDGDTESCTLNIVTSYNFQQISLGPAPEVINGGQSSTDIYLNGCVPFFTDEFSNISFDLGLAGGSAPSLTAFVCRFLFANFEIAPFFFAVADNTSD